MQADGVLVKCPICGNVNVILRQSGDIRQARHCIVCDYGIRWEPVPGRRS